MLTMKPYESYIDDLCSLSKAGKLPRDIFSSINCKVIPLQLQGLCAVLQSLIFISEN